MGFLFTTYRVEKSTGALFKSWNTVLSNVSRNEAEKYIKDKTNGIFGDRETDYRIVKE